MRIEDLDEPRVVAGATNAIYDDLGWLGLDWDDEPVTQSERLPLYAAAIEHLEREGHTYPCTCSRKEIAAHASAPHGASELGVRYPGTCRDGPGHADRDAATRFRMPEPPPSFVDGVHGAVDPSGWGGDFVVRRADGVFSYQLAVVVDDAAMGITEVVRGDDLLPSTPRQIALYRALGETVPEFFHVPLVLGRDGERLSKRHGAVSVADYRAAGWSPERVVGLLAVSVGLAPDASPIDARTLVDRFDASRIPREPTTLDAPG
jgi:glutamyl-tRNA synthetase